MSLSILLLCLFFSCNQNSSKSQVLNLSLDQNITSLDPGDATDRYSIQAISPVYETLFQYNYLEKPYRLEPLLLEKMPFMSADGTVYTFQLKKGILFHDHAAFKNKKRELTVDDVFYSFKRLADKNVQAKGYYVLEGLIKGLDSWRANSIYSNSVSGLVKINDYEFEVHLVSKKPQFLHSLSNIHVAIVAKEVVDFYGKNFSQHAVGTGPFILTKYIPGNSLNYIKNDDYISSVFPINEEKDFKEASGKKLPFVDELTFHISPENHPRWLNFLKGSLDLFYGLAENPAIFLDENKKLQPELKNKFIELQQDLMLTTDYVGLNYTNKFLQNKLIRQALSLAFDREKYSNLFKFGLLPLAKSFTPPGLLGYQEKKNIYTEYNLEKAKELLKEAGFPEGKGLPEFILETKSGTEERQRAEFYSKLFTSLGLKLKINYNTWPELLNKIHKGNNDLFTLSWHMEYPDAENILCLAYGKGIPPKGLNYSRFSNNEFDQIYEQAVLLEDGPLKKNLYEKLDNILREEVPVLFVGHRFSFWLTHGWMKYFKGSNFDYSHVKYYGLDNSKKETLLKKL